MKKIKKPVWLIDTTLRDGIHISGKEITSGQKYKIATTLAGIGINEIEAGIPAEGPEERDFIRSLSEELQDTVITAWCAGQIADIEAASKARAESIHIAFPVSDEAMSREGLDRDGLLRKVGGVLGNALGNFDHISVGAQDASRADKEFLKLFIKTVTKYGIRRVRIADTGGIWKPHDTIRMIRDIKVYSGAFLEFHGHDHSGSASANAISAIQAGADAVSTILGGFCEASGNTELEEFLIYLAFAGRHKATVDLENLLEFNEL